MGGQPGIAPNTWVSGAKPATQHVPPARTARHGLAAVRDTTQRDKGHECPGLACPLDLGAQPASYRGIIRKPRFVSLLIVTSLKSVCDRAGPRQCACTLVGSNARAPLRSGDAESSIVQLVIDSRLPESKGFLPTNQEPGSKRRRTEAAYRLI
jgi:hypothetical protein